MSPTAALNVSKQLSVLDGVPEFVTHFNEATTWEDMLLADGWQGRYDDGVTYWTRPGKMPREGISASTNYAGSDLLYVWSTSVEGLDSDRAYDRYGYMVRRDFDGDFKAAADHFVGKERLRSLVGESLLEQRNPTEEGTEEEDERTRIEQAEMPIGSAEFWSAEQQDRQFLIEPFLGIGRAHALFAEAKAGKSYVVLHRS